MVDFAREIKAIRKALGMNQADFAAAIDASQGSVSKWERGRENPRTDVWIRIQSLYSAHEGHRTASVFDSLYNQKIISETIPAPVVGLLGRETPNDARTGRIDPLFMLNLPRLPDLTEQALAWVMPMVGFNVDDIRPGSIIFVSAPAGGFHPEDGDRVVIQLSDERGGFDYALVYYGVSERGVEWFTRERFSAEKVKLSETSHINDREKRGIFVVGKHLATMRWESSSLEMLDRLTGKPIF